MNKLWHLTALLHNLVKVVGGVLHKLLDCFLISKNTILFVNSVLIDTEVGLSRHEQAVFNNINKAETKEIQRNVHKVRGRIGHKAEDVITN
jgi:hypothetical protein